MNLTRLATLFAVLFLGVLTGGCGTKSTLPPTETAASTVMPAAAAPPQSTDTQPAQPVAPSVTALRVIARTLAPTASPTATAIPACPGSLPWRLTTGQTGKVSEDPPISNRVRSRPEDGAEILGQIAPGEMFTVLEGPTCAGGLTWWRVRSLAQTLEGWTAEGDQSIYFVAPVYTPTPITTTPTTPPTQTPLPGDSLANTSLSVVEIGLPTPTPDSGLADTLLYAQWPEAAGGGTDPFMNKPSLNLVDASGKRLSQFALRHNAPIWDWAWSPDRQKIAYITGSQQLFVANIDGSGEQQYPADSPERVKWSPDSRLLAYMSRDGLRVVSTTTGQDVLVGSLERTPDIAWDWSPDGLSIAVLGEKLIIFRLKDGTRQEVTGSANHGISWMVTNGDFIDWSPDGSRLVFTKEQGLWLANSDGSGLQKLSSCAASYAWPQWSPDGKNIAFLSSCGEEKNLSLYVMPGSGQGPARKVTSGISGMYGIDWSPDGQWIAWVSDAFPFLTKPIFKSKISEETVGVPLTNEKVTASHPVWTP